MSSLDTIKTIQRLLSVKDDGIFGPKSRLALDKMVEQADQERANPANGRKVLRGNGRWPWVAYIDGDDIVVDKIVVTCFGGNGDGSINDPQDSGGTASGRNTKNEVIDGVSIPMDGRQFTYLSSREHRALDGSPIPKIPFGTPVEVTIEGKTFIPKDGIVDLGPGYREFVPAALDVTVPAAGHWSELPVHQRATRFYKIGNYRILGGAKYAV